MVLAAAEKAAAALGIRVVDHYETGLTEEEAIAATSRLLVLSEGGSEQDDAVAEGRS